MKAFLVLLSLVFATTVFAQTTALDKLFTPFKTQVMKKLYRAEDISVTADYRVQEGHFQQRIAKVTYDVGTDGGTIAARGLGVFLPANSIIRQVFFRTDVQFVDAGSGTVALSCEDANNIFTATDITGNAVGTLVAGASTGAVGAMVQSIAAQCEITATVAGAAQTAGRLTLWVEYVVHL